MSYTHFTLEERESLSNLLAAGKNYSQIARELGRHRSTIKREVERNYSKKKQRYHPWRATVLYIIRRKNCRRKPAIAEGMPTYDYVKPRLEMFWPPEVIADRAKEDGISISCSTIYRAVKNGVFEGISPKNEILDVAGNPYWVEEWTPVDEMYEKYDHPIWQKFREDIVGGHGGMDALVLQAFCEAVRNKTTLPIDVYDCAAWMCLTCLSEESIARGSMPVAIPDFTNGKWINETVTPGKWSLDEIFE